MCLTGARLTGKESLAAGLVDATCPEERLGEESLALANKLLAVCKTPAFGMIKRQLNRPMLAALAVKDTAESFSLLPAK